jgi:tripartite-type tricarboxylate transporter receptor subunit TctC
MRTTESITLRSFAACAALLAGLCAASAAAEGPADESYPARTIRFIVPFAASTPVDMLARVAAQKLSAAWHSPVIVENREGAGGTIAVSQVVKAAPDGYTLLFTPDLPIVIGPAVTKTPYDPRKDLAPIGAVAQGVSVLVVNPSTGIKSIAELIAAARAKPGMLTYASSGEGSTSRMCLELIKHAVGIDIVHVPFKSASSATQSVLSGEVSMFCSPLFQALPGVRAHTLTAIGITGLRPTPALPDVAPIAAQGLPDVTMVIWYAVFAPAGTAPAIQRKVRDALLAGFDDGEVRQRMTAAGLDPIWMDTAEMERTIGADLDKWTRLAKEMGIAAQ